MGIQEEAAHGRELSARGRPRWKMARVGNEPRICHGASPSPYFVPGLPHILIELRQALISYQYYRMLFAHRASKTHKGFLLHEAREGAEGSG